MSTAISPPPVPIISTPPSAASPGPGSPSGWAFVANVVNTYSKDDLVIHEDALVLVDSEGIVSNLVLNTDPEYHAKVELAEKQFGGNLIRTGPNGFLTSGLFDLHIHAPQWPMLGIGENLDLAHWLAEQTFPTEARFSDVKYAREVYEEVVSTLLRYGTTTAVYFGSIHVEGTMALAEECMKQGQRAFVGKVVMDNPDECPDFYRETTEDAIAGTREFITRVQAMAGTDEMALVQPVITPRFIPSCTDEVLRALGAMREETGVRLQTHASESDWQVSHGLKRYDGRHDAASLKDFNLLGKGCIMAHGVFITDDCMETYKSHGCGIAHCPLSNTLFSNAVLPVRKLLDREVPVGTGSDVGAGSSPSIMLNARLAVSMARILGDGVDPSKPAAERGAVPGRVDISLSEGFWLATKGAANALGLAHKLGTIEVGKHFDAVQWTVGKGTPVPVFSSDTLAQRFTKLFYLSDDRNATRVWVDGRCVSGSPAPKPARSTIL